MPDACGEADRGAALQERRTDGSDMMVMRAQRLSESDAVRWRDMT